MDINKLKEEKQKLENDSKYKTSELEKSLNEVNAHYN